MNGRDSKSGREQRKPYSGEKAKDSGKYILVGGFWPREAGGGLTGGILCDGLGEYFWLCQFGPGWKWRRDDKIMELSVINQFIYFE